MWLIHRCVRGNQGDAVFLLLDALDGCLVTVDHHDGDVAAVDVLLLADNDDVAFQYPRLHRVAADAQREEFAGGRQPLRYLFPIDDLLNGFDGDAGNDPTEDGDANPVFCCGLMQGRMRRSGEYVALVEQLNRVITAEARCLDAASRA